MRATAGSSSYHGIAMNAIVRAGSGVAAIVLAVALVGYGAAYYVCIHRHYRSIAAGVDFLHADENTYSFFRPAIWIYEQSTGRQVALNPLVHPIEPE